MPGTSSKRPRELGVGKEGNQPSTEERQIKKAKKPRRSPAVPKNRYSKDDFHKYMQGGRMDWDKILESFNFHVEYLRPNQAPPAHSTEIFEFESDVDKALNVRYVIQPREVWSTMSRYRKFTILTSSFAVGDFVLINHGDPSDPEKLATKKVVKGEWPYGETWAAKILKVVAGNESHVYLLVNYFYLPEDIRAKHVSKPTLAGRQKHHSSYEVIMSNELSIVDAKTVAEKIDIKHWREYDDSDAPEPEQIFWRQYLNILTNELSPLRKHCVCEKPSNPEERLIQCENEYCKKWHHEECLRNDLLDRLSLAEDKGKKSKTANGETKKVKTRKNVTPFEITIEERDVPETEPKALKFVIKGPKNGELATWEEDVHCLFCKQGL